MSFRLDHALVRLLAAILALSPTIAGIAAGSATASSAPGPVLGHRADAARPVDGAAAPSLPLPRVPWEGGPAYWKRFPKARAAGWARPGFFPIASWFNSVSDNAEVRFDKHLGLNTYIGMWEGTPARLFADNGVYWIGDRLNRSFTDDSTFWVGDFLDDEVDGRFTAEEGRDHLQSLVDARMGDGRFKYANFTQMVMSRDMRSSDAEAYVNDFTDAVSLDMYYYTIPHCDLSPYRDPYVVSVPQGTCRTAASYGKTIDSLRVRDAADHERQAVWQFVEVLNGGPGEGPFTANITPRQLQGAVMASLIHGARGLVYFNQSLSGPCQSGGVFRAAQYDPNFCGKHQVAAAGAINRRIRALARVLNTQSYRYRFGPALDTMLKAHGKFIYVFAMAGGRRDPGARTFDLPRGIGGRRATVLFENRVLPISRHGVFHDQFRTESSYHIYRVARYGKGTR